MDIVSLHALGLSWFMPIPNLWRISLAKALRGNLSPLVDRPYIYPLQNEEYNKYSPQTTRRGLKSFGIWYQLLRKSSFFSSVLEGIPTAQQYKVSSSLEEVDEGALVDRQADNPEATLILISS